MNKLKEELQVKIKEVIKAHNYTGTLVADMGTGKSKIAIDCIKEGNFKNILITSPRTNLKENWRSELEKWNFEYNVDDVWCDFNQNPTQICVISIENIQTSYKYNEEFIKTLDFIIIDEVHCIGKEYFRLIELALKNNISVLGLTGTPNESDDFKKEVLYQHLPIIYRYTTAAEDGLINKRKYYIYKYDLTDSFKVKVGSKAKPFYKGELSQYLYLSSKYEEAKAEMFKLGASDYFNTSLLWMKGKQRIWIMENGIPESKEIDATKEQKEWGSKFFNAIRYRKEFLWNLNSTRGIASNLKVNILSNPYNKVLLFSELTAQANKLSKYSIHSNNEDEDNKKLLEKFNNGNIRELSSVRSLTLGLNMTGVNWIIMESYNSGDTDAKQKMGRSSRLAVEDTANVIFIVPNNTQAESWFNNLSKDLDLTESQIITNINEIQL